MRSTRIIIIALFAAFAAAAIALLENVVTNEKHPERAVVYGLVALVVLTAIGQAAGRILSARRDDQSAKEIRNIKTDTKEILEIQKATRQDTDEREVDQILTKFPYALRDFIKAQWKNSPEEVRQVIQAASEPASRPAAVLTEWEQSLPGWMASTNWRAVTVAAELAQAYGVNQLASELFLKAASDSTRAHYWIARSSILIYMRGDKQKAVQVLTDRTIDIQSPDLFARIVFCLVTDDRTTCRMLLEQWTPDQPIDIFLSGVVQVQLLIDYSRPPGVISEEDWIKAVRIYRQLINKLPQSAALRIGLASSLINLASNGQSIDRHRDLNEALENAIIARDISREIFASSVQAVEVACQAAYSDMQFRRVIKLGTTITGEATAEEARSDIVQTSVTTAALLLGQTEMADRLILEINDTFRKSILVAMSAEVDGKPLANLWVAALQQARDAYERAQALLGLARMGLAESEQIDKLSHDLPKEAALIRAVSEAATGNLAVAIRQLRSIQDSDISTVTALADVYLKSGNASAAADTLREGASIFNEPRLRIEAARLLSENNDHNAAVVELERLLVDSSGNAVVQHDSLGILAEWSAERGDWSTAQRRYREVLALDPSDYKVRWALILSLLQLGLIRDARRVYDEAPTIPEIILPFHARAWMATRLATDRTDAARFVDEVINIAQRFPDDENVQAEAIFAVLSPDSRRSDPLCPFTG